jgi:hypothetical protein
MPVAILPCRYLLGWLFAAVKTVSLGQRSKRLNVERKLPIASLRASLVCDKKIMKPSLAISQSVVGRIA